MSTTQIAMLERYRFLDRLYVGNVDFNLLRGTSEIMSTESSGLLIVKMLRYF